MSLRFVHDSRGGVAPLLALAMIPILATVGAAIDYSRANAIKSSMQAALDATGLSLARQTAAGASFNVSDYFSGNFQKPEVSNLEVASAVSSVATRV